eukprot:6968938-Prymnesium_polylepis.1
MRCPAPGNCAAAGTSTCAHTVWAASKAAEAQPLRGLCTLGADGVARRIRAVGDLVLGVPYR